MMIFKLAFKNVFSRKSSFCIMAFIAFAISLLFVTNSVFDRTDKGIRENFKNSLCGDLVIRPLSQSPLSLFGDETPVTGSLKVLPLLDSYAQIKACIDSNPKIEKSMVQLTGRAFAEYKKNRFPVNLFGIDAVSYFDFMPSLTLLEGELFSHQDKAVLINASFARELGISAGESLQFVVADGFSSKIRKVFVAGIYSYPAENSVWNNLILTSSELLRDLMGYQAVSADQIKLSEEKEGLLTGNLDDFFDMSQDIDSAFSGGDFFYQENSLEIEAGWNFILCRVKGNPLPVISSLNKTFKENGWNVQAVDWRTASGNSALYVNFLRIILNSGIIVILLIGFIIVNNTLVINVLDRLKEIGTIRSLGASRFFVSLEFMLESFIIAIISALAGILFGILLSFILNCLGLPISNDFLIQLFAGKKLVTSLSFLNFIYCFAVSLFVGLLAWIYPVGTALKISPVEAMRE